MQHNLHDAMALLSRTPAALNAFLRDLPEAWTFCKKEKALGARPR